MIRVPPARSQSHSNSAQIIWLVHKNSIFKTPKIIGSTNWIFEKANCAERTTGFNLVNTDSNQCNLHQEYRNYLTAFYYNQGKNVLPKTCLD